jgi:hypothetical protein
MIMEDAEWIHPSLKRLARVTDDHASTTMGGDEVPQASFVLKRQRRS